MNSLDFTKAGKFSKQLESLYNKVLETLNQEINTLKGEDVVVLTFSETVFSIDDQNEIVGLEIHQDESIIIREYDDTSVLSLSIFEAISVLEALELKKFTKNQ